MNNENNKPETTGAFLRGQRGRKKAMHKPVKSQATQKKRNNNENNESLRRKS